MEVFLLQMFLIFYKLSLTELVSTNNMEIKLWTKLTWLYPNSLMVKSTSNNMVEDYVEPCIEKLLMK